MIEYLYMVGKLLKISMSCRDDFQFYSFDVKFHISNLKEILQWGNKAEMYNICA